MPHEAEPPIAPVTAGPQAAAGAPSPADRRRAPRRRERDRIASLDRAQSPLLRARHDLANHLLLVEDDLRQTALSLGPVESYLARSMALLEKVDLRGEELRAHAEDEEVLERVDLLIENLTNLRRRMGTIAVALGPSRRGQGL